MTQKFLYDYSLSLTSSLTTLSLSHLTPALASCCFSFLKYHLFNEASSDNHFKHATCSPFSFFFLIYFSLVSIEWLNSTCYIDPLICFLINILFPFARMSTVQGCSSSPYYSFLCSKNLEQYLFIAGLKCLLNK